MRHRRINRRSFLQVTGGATAGLVLSSLPRRTVGAPQRVIVLGAGLSGLAAAHEILRAAPGSEVTVLEARPRVGGRVHTVRSDGDRGERSFQDGQHAEAGAQRILPTHDRTLGYIARFGLQDQLVEFSRGTGLFVLRGERFLGDGTWPERLALSMGERAGRLALRGDASFDYAARLYPAVHGTEVFATGPEPWHEQDALSGGPGRNLTLRGGLDQLPRAVAQAVRAQGGVLRLGVAATAIHQDAAGVTVTCLEQVSGARLQLRGERCVCTLPFPALRERVDLSDAGFASDKLGAIAEAQMMPAGRIYLQVRDRPWQREGIGGLQLAGTDTSVERIWHSSDVQPGSAGLIHAYVQLHNARAMAQVPTQERAQLVREELARCILPEAAASWNGLGFATLWTEEEWTGGAWQMRRPGAGDLQARAEGRVHFAGEHTTAGGGWMQDAIESGQRAAREILSPHPAT